MLTDQQKNILASITRSYVSADDLCVFGGGADEAIYFALLSLWQQVPYSEDNWTFFFLCDELLHGLQCLAAGAPKSLVTFNRLANRQPYEGLLGV